MSIDIDFNSTYADSADLAKALAENGMPKDAVLIYDGRRNKVAFTADGKYCIKSYRVPGFIKGLIYTTVRIPKARRAWLNAHRLKELGVDTPDPVCQVVCHSPAHLDRTYYVCLAYHGWNDLRKVEQMPDFKDFARHLALFITELHNKNILMKDLSMGNVLWRIVDGEYQFALIDINRMDFDITDRKVLMMNFGAVLDTVDGIKVLAKHYADINGDPALVDMAIDAFHKKQNALSRKRHLKKFFKSLLHKG